MSLSSVCHAFHLNAKSIQANLKRSHTYEMFAATFGFASYAALNQTGLVLKGNVQSIQTKIVFRQLLLQLYIVLKIFLLQNVRE